jgi:hypothetical protein
MPPQHPINRLLAVAAGLRLLATELNEIQGETPVALVYWAHEIERSITGLRQDASAVPLESVDPSTPSRSIT